MSHPAPSERDQQREDAIKDRAVQRIIEELQVIARRGVNGNWLAVVRATDGVIIVQEGMAPRTSHIVNRTRH